MLIMCVIPHLHWHYVDSIEFLVILPFSMELRNLKECSVAAIQQFYDSKSHHKRQIQSGG